MKTIQMNFESSHRYVTPSIVATTTKLVHRLSIHMQTHTDVHTHTHTHFHLPHAKMNSLLSISLKFRENSIVPPPLPCKYQQKITK